MERKRQCIISSRWLSYGKCMMHLPTQTAFADTPADGFGKGTVPHIGQPERFTTVQPRRGAADGSGRVGTGLCPPFPCVLVLPFAEPPVPSLPILTSKQTQASDVALKHLMAIK
ncbi:Aspartate aminotransferase [Anopheles sinensis]|uniref:Aspartate aminotransferase n=1 Tax=Anopheles sinensis TaxID=74873 RepID=A0A084WU79_ANOSI|nr:Aspartate aminotransferase [Anopheles sinensis]